MVDLKVNKLICTGWMLLALVPTARAIQVSPSYQIFDVKPGESVNGECQVINNEDAVVTVKVHSKDWFVLPENKEFSAVNWLLVDQPEFQLQKGESRAVPFVVKLPEKAVGELVGMVSMEFSGEQQTMLKQVVSVAVYAAVPGTEQLKIELSAVMLNPSTTTLQVGVQVKNVGNVHVRPTGQFWIYDKKGKEVTSVFIKQGRPTYPGREGGYFGEVSQLTLSKGNYTAHILLQDVDRHTQILDVRKKFILKANNKIELTK